jgi:hypothetical protein
MNQKKGNRELEHLVTHNASHRFRSRVRMTSHLVLGVLHGGVRISCSGWKVYLQKGVPGVRGKIFVESWVMTEGDYDGRKVEHGRYR